MSDLFGAGDNAADLVERGGVAIDDKQWAPLLVDMVRVVEADKIRRGAAADEAFRDARAAVLAIAEYFGGRQTYLPKGTRLATALRDAEIWRRYTGSPASARALAAEYGLSEIHMYALLARQRELHRRRLQGRLFPD